MSDNYYEELRLEALTSSEDRPERWIKCPTCRLFYFLMPEKAGCPDCAPDRPLSLASSAA